MVELVKVAFAFNQGEYIAAVPTNNVSIHARIAHTLPDVPDIVIEVILNESHGVKMIKTHEPDEAKTRFREIWEATKLETGEFISNQDPQYCEYELRLKDGQVVDAVIKVEPYSPQLSWEHAHTKKPIKKEDVVGWKTRSKSFYW